MVSLFYDYDVPALKVRILTSDFRPKFWIKVKLTDIGKIFSNQILLTLLASIASKNCK